MSRKSMEHAPSKRNLLAAGAVLGSVALVGCGTNELEPTDVSQVVEGVDTSESGRTDVSQMMEDAGIEPGQWSPSEETLIEYQTRQIADLAKDANNPEGWFDAVAIRDAMLSDPKVRKMVSQEEWSDLEGLVGESRKGSSYDQLNLDLVNIGHDRVNEALDLGDIETADDYIESMAKISRQNPSIRDKADSNDDGYSSVGVSEARANVTNELFDQGMQAINDKDAERAREIYQDLKTRDWNYPNSRVAADRLGDGQEQVAHVRFAEAMRASGFDPSDDQ